ncbi:MAG: dehydrogenase [Dictyoglomus sp. NZ13-RE01]|nr:MAG: dehydrogenase [Dictyoglomus sp. NZ13-RE01]
MLRVGIIGFGTMGRVHFNAYKSIPETQVVAICEETESLNFPDIKIYRDPLELIRDKNVDLVDICYPTPYHKDLSIFSLREGKHVICEKPLARTLREGEEILNALEKTDRKFFVGHVLRFFPQYEMANSLIMNGTLGKVGVANLRRCGPFPIGRRNWYANFEMSGGVPLDLVIHDFDFARWTFGDVERIYAKGSSPRGQKNIDYFLCVLRHESGVITHVEGSWSHPTGFFMGYEITGEKGMLEFDSRKSNPIQLSLKFLEEKEGKVAYPESPLREDPYTKEIAHFVDCIVNNREPIVNVFDAYKAMEISIKAIESIEKEKVISLKGGKKYG